MSEEASNGENYGSRDTPRSRGYGEVLTVTGETVIYSGTELTIFSVQNLEPLEGGASGVFSYRLTRAVRPLTDVDVPPGVGVRHNVTGLTLNVKPGGKPWKCVVQQLVPG